MLLLVSAGMLALLATMCTDPSHVVLSLAGTCSGPAAPFGVSISVCVSPAAAAAFSRSVLAYLCITLSPYKSAGVDGTRR